MEREIHYSTKISDAFFRQVIDYVGAGVVITDPSLPDNPIIYTNKAFETVTGYTTKEIIGQNCRFLQGEKTSREEVAKVRKAIEEEQSIIVELLNYRKDGKPFWNELSMYPIFVPSEDKLYFVGVQKDVSDRKSEEIRADDYKQEASLLSTPFVPISEKICILPLVGNINSERWEEIYQRISAHVYDHDEEIFIMDLQGIKDMNDDVHSGILRLHKLLQVMGARLIVTGIEPNTAKASVKLADFRKKQISFYATVQQALEGIRASH
ncbi:PAS domain-containing protein [Terribacillus saccharophilus]|uniref:STAS domain-containing protein n=1 Tax=Terribacillus saccharophilus TaxID=361277 RepID=UPI003981B293